ncbi:hypothetical protein CRENBAI_009712 [Crenichthys baileyi]|uniref:Uncharacterized protein n=1 Tax=Crenichthys baileyi TaxID=28760 RepID=A0AAV9QXT2_9TELE
MRITRPWFSTGKGRLALFRLEGILPEVASEGRMKREIGADTVVMRLSRASAPPHREESVEGAQASVLNAPWTPPSEGVPGTSHQEEAQDTLEGLCLLAGLGMPW